MRCRTAVAGAMVIRYGFIETSSFIGRMRTGE